MSIIELIITFCYLVLHTSSVHAFQKSQCNADVIARLENGTIAADDLIFHRNVQGLPMSKPSNLVLTLPGCKETCGTGRSFYEDVGPRLTTWLIPILLLIGNMHMARLGTEKYAALLHFLGDPIDTMWSLLTKAETWSRCLSLAQRTVAQAPTESKEHYDQRVVDIATIYAAIEELEGSGTDKFKDFFDRIVADKRPDMTMDHFYHLCKETANELSDSRSVELRRAGLAVFAYFYHVIAGFVAVIGGESSSPPGGRIGTSMFISWLIPAVLFSNALGGFTSRRTCLRIMERFAKTVTHNAVEDRQLFSSDKPSSFSSRKSNTDFYAAQCWSGAIYCYRPRKSLFRGGRRDNNAFKLFILSTLPVLVSTVTSVALIWVTPTVGFDCRSLMMVCISILWLLSAGITFLTWVTGLADGVYHYRLTMLKDAMIGIPVLLIIILSSCGIFNSCFCWSAIFSLGRAGAFVVLDDHDERSVNAKTYYPGLVAACLGLQMVVVLVMLWTVRHGSALFRRDEVQKQEDWLETHVRRSHIRTFTFDDSTTGWVRGRTRESEDRLVSRSAHS
ncbi:hypothetical protein BDW62DRAFT_202389 [Aspergillus aurantiobrunneus]